LVEFSGVAVTKQNRFLITLVTHLATITKQITENIIISMWKKLL